MPRSKVGRKRPHVNQGSLRQALNAVQNKTSSIRAACKTYNVTFATLTRYLRKSSSNPTGPVNKPNYDIHRVFTNAEEEMLVDYIQMVAKMQYGLTKKKVRELAFKFAVANGKKYPSSWDKENIAGETWMKYFMKRNLLCLRKPEKRSQHRSACFNKTNVGKFYDNIESAHERLGPFEAHQIWNIDETACLTVHEPPKIVTVRGSENVASTTAAERGQLVTMIACVSASGNHIPPGFIFPRVNFKDFMISGAPPGSFGAANPSGWSTERIFDAYLDHFIKHVRPTKENRVLLIFDNHETHLSVKAVEKARDMGIVMLTFPPHTSDKLQPLDVSVFKPFKHYYNLSLDTWQTNNPGKTFGIYDVAKSAGEAFSKAFSTSNIMSGFRSPGICPFNRIAFDDSDFISNYATDRENTDAPKDNPIIVYQVSVGDDSSEITLPQPTPESPRPSTSGYRAPPKESNPPKLLSGSSNQCQTPNAIEKPKRVVTPEELQPYPKAPPRKEASKRRTLGKTRIVTDTPEKEELILKKIKLKPKTKTKRTLSKNPNKTKPKEIQSRGVGISLKEKIKEIQHENKKFKNMKRCEKCKGNEDFEPLIECLECKNFWHPNSCLPKQYDFCVQCEEDDAFLCPSCRSVEDEDVDDPECIEDSDYVCTDNDDRKKFDNIRRGQMTEMKVHEQGEKTTGDKTEREKTREEKTEREKTTGDKTEREKTTGDKTEREKTRRPEIEGDKIDEDIDEKDESGDDNLYDIETLLGHLGK